MTIKQGGHAHEDANELVILSDDGDEQVDGRDCKKKKVPVEKKNFRSRTIPLPLATVARVPSRRSHRSQAKKCGSHVR